MLDNAKRNNIEKWADDHPEYNEFFAALAARKKNSRETELENFLKSDNLKPEGRKYEMKRRAIEFFRGLQGQSVGEFRIGRRGSRTRFIWSEPMVEVARAAHVEARSSRQTSDEEVANEVIADRNGARTVMHHYVLRQNFVVTFELPIDLTGSEADRLSAMVQTLPLDRETRGETS
jgi:hypothetical protein